MPDNRLIFIVLKNSDFTEGRGGYFFHKAFDSLSAARDYVSTQPGIMGSAQGPSNHYSAENVVTDDYTEVWNGYLIESHFVLRARDVLTISQRHHLGLERDRLAAQIAEIDRKLRC